MQLSSFTGDSVAFVKLNTLVTKNMEKVAGFLKNVVETWPQASLRQKGRSCKGDAAFLPRLPSACEQSIKMCSKRHGNFGKITALLLARTLEDTARGETQSSLRQNRYLIWRCLYSFMPSSPHLAYDLHQKKAAKLASSLLSCICRRRTRFCDP